ncbi:MULTISPECIES: hypothetical protein [Actinomadura]|uniref:YncE family protein n=1 Tax=Actinomadura yumaensis TaxID=111807 RepID=A0ABW2CV39_9ACTN|nr:hypothetical protein [Actinomadura sp. J1-007]MWK36083.1 hypothetical protein [Actinomadura sp. J1-007]
MTPHRRRSRTRRPGAAVLAAVALPLSGCGTIPFYRPGEGSRDAPVVGLGAPAPYLRGRGAAPVPARPGAPSPYRDRRPSGEAGAPAVYAGAGPGMLAPAARALPPRLYVPGARGGVGVADPRAGRAAGRAAGRIGLDASRVVASPDPRRLWTVGDRALVPFAARTGRPGAPVPVTAPTGLLFTPDGRDALVTAARPDRIEVRDPRTMRRRASFRLPCAAAHADFSFGGTALLASCPDAGRLVRVDPYRRAVTGTLRLPAGSRPGDLRLSPDAAAFYVADAARGGVWLVGARRLARLGFVRTGAGARGLAVGRDARRLFVAGAGTVSAVAFDTRRVVARWHVPGGGTPLVGGVSADGAALWLADRAGGLVYAVSTRTGRVLSTIRVAGRPAGLCLHPQPGRALGGTGLYR